MRLKSFHAKTMSEAMRQVRDTLGEDAIIVSSKEEKSGWVKITAAIEQMNAAAEAEESIDAETGIETITEALLKHRVPATTSDRIISAAISAPAKTPRKMLSAALKKTFAFTDMSFKKPLILVGPPGAGKTLMTAKLAARLALGAKSNPPAAGGGLKPTVAGGGIKPLIITTDIARAGGVEQLSAFLDILGIPLAQAEDAKELKSILSKAKAHTPVIIDTGGLNPFDPQEMKFLAKLLHAVEAQSALVLPAGIDAEESAEIALTFEVLGVKTLIPTRLDFARRLGGILSAAERANLSFTEASHTPQVVDGILTLTPDIITDLLMPHSSKKR